MIDSQKRSILEPKRLLQILGFLYFEDAELVIEIPNQEENWNDPVHSVLKVHKVNRLILSEEETDWLEQDNIVVFDSGNNDPELFYQTRVYIMSEEGRSRFLALLIKKWQEHLQKQQFS